jgi:hemoglobin/transferrin/lactoferrin receptor protein
LKRVLIFFILLISNFLFAQKITIIDKSTNEPISSVTASNILNSKHCVSDIDGIIDLNIFNESETIFFKHLNYEEYYHIKKRIVANKKVYLNAKSNSLDEVFLSASKKEVKRSRIAQEITTISAKDIIKETPQTAADMLANIPGIKVQKSQFGGGSPVLRGMEANRILLVVDGVRMNNAIYRKGHLQNSISISPNMLERTEVIFGPSSVMYGSDALGGVIHYYTKKPKVNNTFRVIPNFLARYGTVNNEATLHGAIELQSKKIASFTSISHSKFGDLKMGKNRTHGYDNWGLQPYISNNTSSHYNENPIANPDPEKQKNVGFNQLDILQKIIIPLSKATDLNFNIQYSKSSNIDRFDKLTQLSGGTLKFAEWYYGPQKRFLASSQIEVKPERKWLDNGTITIAYQNIKESRVQRKFNSLKRYYRFEDVAVFSINGDFEVPIAIKNKRTLSYGTEFTFNKVNSTSKGKTIQIDGNNIVGLEENFIVQTRYPDDGSRYTSSAFYIDYRQDISKKQTLNTGIRVSNTTLQAKWMDETYIVLPDNDIVINNTAATATIGYVFKPKQALQLNAVISSGFRSPNIDDIGKIREKNGFVTVPNINLKPEQAYNAEFSFIKYFNGKKANLSFTTYYTLLDKYITRDLFPLNGSNTIEYDGETVITIANVNKGTAYIYGGTLSFNGKITKNFYGKASTTYTKGRSYDTQKPLSSIPPIFGVLEIGYNKNNWDTSINLRFNGEKKFKDYNLPEGIDNIEQTPLNPITGEYDLGNPSWKTLNFATTYKLNNKIDLMLHIDNIFNTHYKEFASSISAPGRNFSFTVISKF